jgi:hypothetical protein
VNIISNSVFQEAQAALPRRRFLCVWDGRKRVSCAAAGLGREALEKQGYTDVIGGLALVAIGAFMAMQSAQYSVGTLRHVGSGFFPLALSILLLSLGAIIGVVGFFKRQSAAEIQSFNLICVVLSVLAFYFSVERLGLALAVILTVCICSLPAKLTWGGRLVLSLSVAVACYLVFVLGLRMTIPVLPNVL